MCMCGCWSRLIIIIILYIFSTKITYVFYQIIVGIFITFLSHGAVLCLYVCV